MKNQPISVSKAKKAIAATSSVSTSLEPAGGRSDGGVRKDSIAFGTLQLWTSTRVESRLVLSVP
jgi:hypothetical protein